MNRFAAFLIALAVLTPTVASGQTASDVVDRNSLRRFVIRALVHTDVSVDTAAEVYEFADQEFRPFGRWRNGPIYIDFMETDGVVLFNAADNVPEGRNLWDVADENGVYFARELIAKARSGGGFVEYLFDNPEVGGDEERGSPKVGYSELLTFDDSDLVIISGYYPSTSVPALPFLDRILKND